MTGGVGDAGGSQLTYGGMPPRHAQLGGDNLDGFVGVSRNLQNIFKIMRIDITTDIKPE